MLKLHSGEKFIVLNDNDTIILKRIKRPADEEFKIMLKRTRNAIKKVGITPEDLDKAIKSVRRRKNESSS